MKAWGSFQGGGIRKLCMKWEVGILETLCADLVQNKNPNIIIQYIYNLAL